MPAPRLSASEREASIEYEGKTYKVKYVPLSAPVEIECRDEATVFSSSGQKFYPWKYLFARTKRSVVEIDGERMDPSSLAWMAMPSDFLQLLQDAIVPKTEPFRERIEAGSPGTPK